jgi:hypothetical protein
MWSVFTFFLTEARGADTSQNVNTVHIPRKPQMTPLHFRRIARWSHIVASVAIGTLLYSPLKDNAAFHAVVAYGVFPFAGLTGIAMWQQGRLRRWLGAT